MFILTVESHFSAAHQIKGYPGDCAGMHGHTYKVQARVAINKLNEIGMAMDFRSIQTALDTIIAALDHTTLNDLPYFKEHNATTERIAMFIYEKMKHQTTNIHSITVWEGHNNSVTYQEGTP
jgi:6-pyruvoyltetrahydropterin/6-carboxytetrahydropterin synthase